MIEEGLNTVPWVTVHGMKVNHTDLELFQLMKAAGCKRVGFGVENGDENMLRNVIRKGQTLDQVREAFANAKAAKLQTMGFFIFGMPGDNEETMEKTIKHVHQMRETMKAIKENNILKMYVDETVLNFMGSREFESSLMQNETVDATVAFMDICSFTTISEHESPDKVVKLLNNYFDVMVKEIIDQGGYIDKFIGDAIGWWGCLG